MTDFPRSLIDFQRRLPDKAACAAYLGAQRWPEGFRCPACAHAKGWALVTTAFTFECAARHRQTSLTAGTLLHGSKLPLTAWFRAAYLMATHSNGISAAQLQGQLGRGSYKERLAALSQAPPRPGRSRAQPLVRSGGNRRDHDPPSHQGGARRRRRRAQPRGQAADCRRRRGRRPGRIRLAGIADFSAASLHAFLRAHVAPGVIARTDAWAGYPGAPGVSHQPHVIGPMAAHLVLPWIHRVFGNLKHWALGVYHGRTRHAAFRTQPARAATAAPLTYKMSISPEPAGQGQNAQLFF